jgi:hypothetical protein
MATMLSNRRSTFGIDCVQCHEELIAPEKSNTVTVPTFVISGFARNARHILNR